MQELLGRIARLDPTASLGLRVIACFDELVVGNVNTRALLAAAASLAGCAAGLEQERPSRRVRVTPRGELATGPAPGAPPHAVRPVCDGLVVWLERDGEPKANDTVILERLALAVRLRHGSGRRGEDDRRDLGILVDGDAGPERRCTAAAALRLSPTARYRLLAAPLFAVWASHPDGPGDVVPTRHGPLHALVLADGAEVPDAAPSGLGVATTVEHLHHSWRTAVLALRLCDADTRLVRADEFGGLIDLLADAPADTYQPDVAALDQVAQQPWGLATLDALVRAQSLRHAARHAGVHHSTMQARLDAVVVALGFDPLDGFGRTRLCTAYLVWRLRHSRALDLPAPFPAAAG